MQKNKQNSVDWLIDQIKNEDHHTEGELGNSCIDVNTLLMLCDQTKQMEKEQIIDAHNNGKNILFPNENGEQYYNETYGKDTNDNTGV